MFNTRSMFSPRRWAACRAPASTPPPRTGRWESRTLRRGVYRSGPRRQEKCRWARVRAPRLLLLAGEGALADAAVIDAALEAIFVRGARERDVDPVAFDRHRHAELDLVALDRALDGELPVLLAGVGPRERSAVLLQQQRRRRGDRPEIDGQRPRAADVHRRSGHCGRRLLRRARLRRLFGRVRLLWSFRRREGPAR